MPPTIPQENRNQAKMIPAVFHSPDSYWKDITFYEWLEMAAFKQLWQKRQEGNLKMAPQPSVPLPQTFFSYCSFSKRHKWTRWQAGHGHIILSFSLSLSLLSFFCCLSISNEEIHIPRAKGMRGENESHLWCPIVQRWLLWTSLSPAPELLSCRKIPL